MDPAKIVEKIQASIKAQKKIKQKCEQNGDEVGAKRAQRAIDRYEKELANFGRNI